MSQKNKVLSQERKEEATRYLKEAYGEKNYKKYQKGMLKKYREHFKVDGETAVKEMEELGIHVPDQVTETLKPQEHKSQKKNKKNALDDFYDAIDP
ncbi:MAG: hypothetical protein IIZ39_00985, partial [Blautia sp.]|nr:hypothetical protein [Blautia sp.]